MPNYFEKAAQDRGVSGNKKTPAESQPSLLTNPTLQRVMKKRVQKTGRKSYTFYLRKDLVAKLNQAADQAEVGISNLLEEILEDVFRVE